jgi:hypothetical protein
LRFTERKSRVTLVTVEVEWGARGFSVFWFKQKPFFDSRPVLF